MENSVTSSDLAKRAAATRALEFVESGMTLGLGTGSTAEWFVRLLSERITDEGLEVLCVATSVKTKKLADDLKIPLRTLDQVTLIDLVVDGADEFDSFLNLVKGGGGALLQEKIVASSARQMVVISDSTKEVSCLGDFGLPIEIIKFGASSTKRQVGQMLRKMGYENFDIKYRRDTENKKFLTDENHYIFDLPLGEIKNADELHKQLIQCPGVVETGLFIGMADIIVVGDPLGKIKLIGEASIK